MNLSIDNGAGLTAYEENGTYYMQMEYNKTEISKEFFEAILKEFSQ